MPYHSDHLNVYLRDFTYMTTITPKYSSNSRLEMLNFITNHPKASLEVGCREGLFSHAIKDKYGDVSTWGVEIDQSVSRDSALGNLDNVIDEPYPECIKKLHDMKFDLVIFNDVLEHIYDPWNALTETKRILSENGVVVISLPNIRYKGVLKGLIFHDDFKYTSSGILDISHIHR